jgi:hypothetical protein
MANTATNMTTQVYLDWTLKGFTDYFVPMNIWTLDASPAPVDRGSQVVVPFVISGSVAQDWAAATGYVAQSATREGLQLNINKHKYVYTHLNDTEVANSAITSLQQVAYNQGAGLAAAVATDILTVFTSSNYSNGATLDSASLVSVSSLIDVREAVSGLKWPEVGRNIIMKSKGFKFLLKDNDLKYIYRGSGEVQTGAQIRNVFGWEGVYENNLLPSLDSGKTLAHVSCNRDAVLVANRYLAPQEGHKYSVAVAATHPESGITLGLREWYDEAYGRKNSVIECSYGYRVGNPAAAYLTRVTSNT